MNIVDGVLNCMTCSTSNYLAMTAEWSSAIATWVGVGVAFLAALGLGWQIKQQSEALRQTQEMLKTQKVNLKLQRKEFELTRGVLEEQQKEMATQAKCMEGQLNAIEIGCFT